VLKFTQKLKDHLAKAVITPLSLTVLGALTTQAFLAGNVWLMMLGVFLFLDMQLIALLLLQEDNCEG